jgi:hypothetical protein
MFFITHLPIVIKQHDPPPAEKQLTVVMINILYAFLSVLLVGIVFLDEAVDRDLQIKVKPENE